MQGAKIYHALLGLVVIAEQFTVGTLVSRCARLSTAADVRLQYRHRAAGVCVALIWCGPGTYSCASNCPLKAGITHIPKAATSSILSHR